MPSPKDPPMEEFRILEAGLPLDETVERMCAVFTEDCILEDTTRPETFTGRDALRSFNYELLRGLPDFRVNPLEIYEVDNTSIMHLELSGHHQGEFMGVPATGREITWRGVAIYRCTTDNAQVHHETWAYDAAGILAQLTA